MGKLSRNKLLLDPKITNEITIGTSFLVAPTLGSLLPLFGA
jgi:hypothetical protein